MNVGLFSLPELQKPSDFETWTKKAIEECDEIRSSLAAIVNHYESFGLENSAVTSKEEASHILEQLDNIVKLTSDVCHAAELCRNVHCSHQWRTAADTAFMKVSDYLTLLKADTNLEKAADLVSNTRTKLPPVTVTSSSSSAPTSIWNQLSEEEQQFTKFLDSDREHEKKHVKSYEDRMLLLQLQNEMFRLEHTFLQNITSCRKEFTVDNWEDVTDVLPSSMLPKHDRLGNTDSHIIQTLLRYSTSASLRRQLYMEHNTAVPENLLVLQELIHLRHEFAQRHGFKSYLDLSVTDEVAGSKKNVLQFLQLLRAQNEAAFSANMDILSKAKQYFEGDANLEPWDIAAYSNFLNNKLHDDFAFAVSQYFTLTNTIQAMQVLVQRLFGIEMREETLSPLEQWDVESGEQSNYRSSTTKLKKFVFNAPDGSLLGTFYFDLYPRDEKFMSNPASQVSVRTACGLSQTSNSFPSSLNNGDHDQHPIVVLLFNIPNSPILSHPNVETLFHEFGHALHSLLSRTRFHHMSAMHSAMDFIEIPSHVLEHYAWDADFLPILGRHVDTGAAMPDDLIQKLRQSQYLFSSVERQNEILLSLFDQKLFGIPDPDVASSSQLFSKLHQQFGVPFVEGTHWYTRFSHLATHGGTYYSYLYGKSIAQDIWDRLLSQGRCLDRIAGDQLWNKLLRHGGAKDPRMMLTNLLGRPPIVDFT
jgi:mitochondrial intermediate peptidase